ncbi:MAG: methionine gamma-lyase family protein [Clostridiales bacterium]|nr:methionine gamma-lyase family protein [Clostridiales bacterium]
MANDFFDFDSELTGAAEDALKRTENAFKEIESVTEYNQQKVLSAFIKNKVSESHLWGTTGYGYGDAGREIADKITAECFGGESAVISYSFACGTHALDTALFALLRPGDNMLCITGRPYDTICPVIGMDGKTGQGSLADYGINYMQTDLDNEGHIDLEAVKKAVKENSVKLIYIQRSRGYTLRPSLSTADIGRAAQAVKSVKPENTPIIMVDNCYGEFVEKTEPLSHGADLIVGSLIKNPGGGVAKCGGYIAGKKDLVELCTYRLTTPSLGREVGASLSSTRDILMGLYHAPHVVGESLKTAVFAAALFENLGFEATPKAEEPRHDIIQAVKLKNSENLIAFCQGLQKGSPVDSYVTPEPWDMPGYPCKVIMAAGAFTSGSSIELSADAPLREPFAVWMQGGLNFHSGKVGVMLAAQGVISHQ